MNRNKLKFTAEDRLKRQEAGTVYQQLISMGFTPEEIEQKLSEVVNSKPREIHLASFQSRDRSDPIIGVSYSGDFRSEEEDGLLEISKTFANHRQQSDFASKMTTNSGLTAYVINESADKPSNISGSYVSRSLRDAEGRHLNPYNDTGDAYRYSVSDLRKKLKGLVNPIPSNRMDLEAAYSEYILGRPVLSTASVGEFHYGKALAMMTDDKILSATLEILFEDSVKGNFLDMGSTSHPFMRSSFFYDARDVSPWETVKRSQQKQQYNDAMELAKDSISSLKDSGHLYSIKPARLKSVVGRPELGEGDYYYINFTRRSDREQVFGWYTIEELNEITLG